MDGEFEVMEQEHEEHAFGKENDHPGSTDGSLGGKTGCTVGPTFV